MGKRKLEQSSVGPTGVSTGRVSDTGFSQRATNPNQNTSVSSSTTSTISITAVLKKTKSYLTNKGFDWRLAMSGEGEGDIGNLVHNEVSRHVGLKDLLNLRITCARLYCSLEDTAHFRKFIHHVVYHEPPAVRAMLDAHPKLPFKDGEITDPGGEFEEPMSAWQYVMWAGDINLADEFKQRINAQAETGDASLLELAKRQADELENRKVSLRRNRWNPNVEGELLYAYKAYLEEYTKIVRLNSPLTWDYPWNWEGNQLDKLDKLDKLWLLVGMAQMRAPRHYILEMCLRSLSQRDSRLPNFEEKLNGDLPPACYRLYDQSGFDLTLHSMAGDLDLGVKSSLLFGGYGPLTMRSGARAYKFGSRHNPDAFTSLINVRFTQIESLISECESHSVDSPVVSLSR